MADETNKGENQRPQGSDGNRRFGSAARSARRAAGSASRAGKKTAGAAGKKAAKTSGKKAGKQFASGAAKGAIPGIVDPGLSKRVQRKREARGKSPEKNAVSRKVDTAAATAAAAGITTVTGGVIPPAVANKLAALGIRNKKKLMLVSLLSMMPVPLIALFLVVALGFSSLPSFGIDPSSQAQQQISSSYLDAYQQAGSANEVPWNILAAIGYTATQNGKNNPYTNTSTLKSWPDASPAIVPVPSQPGNGVGPMLLDQNVASKLTHGNPQNAQASIDAVAQLLAAAGQNVAKEHKINYQDMVTNTLDKEQSYWAEAIATLPISIGDNCAPPQSSAGSSSTTSTSGPVADASQMASNIEYVFSCEVATTQNLALGIGNGIAFTGAAAKNELVAEALQVSWLYSKYGTASGNCNPFPPVGNTPNNDCNSADPSTQANAQIENIRDAAKAVIAASTDTNSALTSNSWAAIPGAVANPPGSTTPTTSPTNVLLEPSDGKVGVSWTAVSNINNTPVTGYAVTASPGTGLLCTTTGATSCTVSGLTNGTAYTFTVVATNAAGTLSPAASAGPVTPSAKTPVPVAASDGWPQAVPPSQACQDSLAANLALPNQGSSVGLSEPYGAFSQPLDSSASVPPTSPVFEQAWSTSAFEQLRNSPACFVPSTNGTPGPIDDATWKVIVLKAAYEEIGQEWVSQGYQVSTNNIQGLINYLNASLQAAGSLAQAPVSPVWNSTSALPRQSNPVVSMSLPLSGQVDNQQVVPLVPIPVGSSGFAATVLALAQGYDARTASASSCDGGVNLSGPMTEYSFGALVMQYLKVPVTQNNIDNYVRWIIAEDPWQTWWNPGHNNPQNVNASGSGSDTFSNLMIGAQVTAQTIDNGYYPGIINAFKTNAALKDFSIAVYSSPWAAGHYGVSPWAPSKYVVPGRTVDYFSQIPLPPPVVAPADAMGPGGSNITITSSSTCTAGGSGSGSAIVNAALSVYQSPYLSGGQGPASVTGFDCSGLVQYSLLQAGVKSLPGNLGGGASTGTTANAHGMTTHDMATEWASHVLTNGQQPQPGDVILYFNVLGDSDPGWDHTAIYIGNGQAVGEGGPPGAPGSIGSATGNWYGAIEYIRP